MKAKASFRKAHSRRSLTLREGVRRLRAEPEPPHGLRRALEGVGIDASGDPGGRVSRTLRRRTAGRWAAAVSVVLAGAWFCLLMSGDFTPQLAVPDAIRSTSPNAFDTLDEALARQFATRTALRAVDSGPGLIREEQETVALVRRALQEHYVRPRSGTFVDRSLETFDYRELGMLLVREGEAHLQARGPDKALASALDCIRLGVLVSNNTNVTGRLRGRAIEWLGRTLAWQLVNHVGKGDAAAAVEYLDRLRGNEYSKPVSGVIEEEMRETQECLMSAFSRRWWRQELVDQVHPAFDRASWFARSGTYLSLCTSTKWDVLDAYTREMEHQVLIVASDQVPPPREFVEPLAQHSVSTALLPKFDSLLFGETLNLAQNRMLMLAFSLRSHYLYYGSYPASIKDRELSYSDPFRPGEPFCYEKTKEGYLLYSVGPDGRDQGGKPIENPDTYVYPDSQKRPDADDPWGYDRFYGEDAIAKKNPYIVRASTGDIVAGVNQR